MTALLELARPRARTTLDTATLLARFGLAPCLVAHWTLDDAGRPIAVWCRDIVPHRPSIARKPDHGGS
jgi:hypothetical protein